MANKTVNQFLQIVESFARPKRSAAMPEQALLQSRPTAMPVTSVTRVRLRRSGLTTQRYQIIQAGSVGRVVTHGPGWLVVDFNGALVKVARTDDRIEVLS